MKKPISTIVLINPATLGSVSPPKVSHEGFQALECLRARAPRATQVISSNSPNPQASAQSLTSPLGTFIIDANTTLNPEAFVASHPEMFANGSVTWIVADPSDLVALAHTIARMRSWSTEPSYYHSLFAQLKPADAVIIDVFPDNAQHDIVDSQPVGEILPVDTLDPRAAEQMAH